MSIDIRLPNINGATEKEQLQQVKSYLYQFAEQLKWALNTLESNSSHGAASGGIAYDGSSVKQTAAESEKTFSSIKSLILKSADIVDAYYEQISRKLSGSYVAQSDFGTYLQDTIQDVEETSTATTQRFTNLQEILAAVHQYVATNAYIRTGLLEELSDGTTVYGVEVGQTNKVDGEEVFSKFSRFTSDRLSFYDNNSAEVAYVSDYKLYITNAEITGTLKIGGYIVDTTNGIAFKWVGRG